MTSWHFAIDRGGTFTDIVARASDGGEQVLKLLWAQALPAVTLVVGWLIDLFTLPAQVRHFNEEMHGTLSVASSATPQRPEAAHPNGG